MGGMVRVLLQLSSTLIRSVCSEEKMIKFRVWNILSEIKESVFCVIFNKDSGKI